LLAFSRIFDVVESGNPDENYDEFCRINKDNEKRKSLSSFFVNLALNEVIPLEKIVQITTDLLKNVMKSILLENKKAEVDEMIENVSIFYHKTWMSKFDEVPFIYESIQKLAVCKAKTFPSLSNKSIFKCMDIIEM
jgi:hypothetical protein